jgi:hypothetical protein
MSDEPMKVIATYDNEAELETALALLQEAGIKVLTSRDTASASLFGQTPYELAEIAVPESQADEALGVLAQLETPPAWEEKPEKAITGWVCPGCDTVVTQEEPVCPECGTERGAVPAGGEEEED